MPPGEPLDDSPLPNCPIRDTVFTERDKQLLTELLRWHSRGAWSLDTPRLGQKASREPGHQPWALLCRYRCRLLFAEIPKGVDRNSELKQRLHLWETGQKRPDLRGPGSAKFWTASQNSKEGAATDRRTAGNRACALTAPRSISNAMKGLVGGAAQGSTGCRRDWTAALIPRSSHWNSSLQCGVRRGGWNCLGRWKVQHGTELDEGRAEPEQVSLRCRTSTCRL